jgi:RNA polymerase sigma factor (sigma-70 family)
MDDLDLVAAVRAGDDRAFEILFLRYQPRIAAYVGGMVRDHGRAEDITQEVFMAALRRLREEDGREIHFRPWIYEIAKNKCIDAYRRGRHTSEVSFDADNQVGAADHGRLAEPTPTPDAAVEGKLAFDNLRGAFGGLSEVHHDILVMREFEGLSYREIGERLGMSRAAVESTLFRARKRLGEEYEELVSGKRCLRVQHIVADAGLRSAGLRDQRRVARHLAHCQPCRRHAHLAGANVHELVRPASAAARVAAFLPLPAFLRRRWGASDDAAPILSQQAARPAAQWSAQVAAALDPGALSSWAKAAAAVATVALAGVGGSAIGHRGPVPHRTGPAAAHGAAGQDARSARSRPAGASGPVQAAADAAAARSATTTSSAGGRSGAGQTGSAPAPATGAGKASHQRAGLPATDPQRTVGSLPRVPLEPVAGAATGTLAPVLDAAGNPSRALNLPAGATRGLPTTGALQPDGLLGGGAPPAAGVAGTGGGSVPNVARDVVPAAGTPGDALRPVTRAPQASADHAAPSTGRGDSVAPTVTDALPNPIAPRTSLGG